MGISCPGSLSWVPPPRTALRASRGDVVAREVAEADEAREVVAVDDDEAKEVEDEDKEEDEDDEDEEDEEVVDVKAGEEVADPGGKIAPKPPEFKEFEDTEDSVEGCRIPEGIAISSSTGSSPGDWACPGRSISTS